MENMTDTEYERNFILCYCECVPGVRKYIRCIVNSPEIADELAQDVFLKLYEKRIPLVPGAHGTMNFLLTVAKNTSFDYIKRKKREAVKYRDVCYEEIAMDRQFYNDVENMYISGEVISTLHDTINSFPEKKREIFMHKVLYNEKNMNISKDLSVSNYLINRITREITGEIRSSLRGYYPGGYPEEGSAALS